MRALTLPDREKLNLLGAQVRRLPTTGREAAVLWRANFLPLHRPDQAVYALRALRHLGMLGASITIAAHRDPHGLGLVDERGELTFGDLDRRSNALARAWQRRGIDHTSVIALLCRDHRGLVEAMFASGKVGATALLMNTGFAKPQFAEVCEREGVSALVYDIEFEDILGDVETSVPRYLGWVDDPASAPHETLEELISATDGAPLRRPAAPGGLTLLTSGTTGTPKGAPRHVSSPFAAAQFMDRIPLRTGERTFLGAPLFHGTGLSQFLLTMSLGSTTILRRKFDPQITLEQLAKYRAEALVVPTMLQRILALGEDEIRSHDTSSLRVIFCAGSALLPEVGNRATELFGDVIYNLYGSTEVAVATVATPEDWKQAPGTVGRSPVGCIVQLYDEAGKRITAPGTVARVFVGSGLRFAGYTGGGTKDEIDGLLSSGDVGHFDAGGLLFIDGRDDDMIVSGGENVFPAEVEGLLVEHPAVVDAAVIGVDDEDFGHRLKAFVVLRDGESLDADAVRAHVKSNLARHKVPRDIDFVEELPRNATGKLLRGKLS